MRNPNLHRFHDITHDNRSLNGENNYKRKNWFDIYNPYTHKIRIHSKPKEPIESKVNNSVRSTQARRL